MKNITLIHKICLTCKKEFTVDKSRNNKGKRKYCSKECYYDSLKGTIRLNKRKQKIKKICLICNKEFFVHPYRKDTAKFCSKKCQIKFNALQRIGKHHTEETKEKIRRKRLGKKLSDEWIKNLSKSHKGIKYLERSFKKGRIPWNKGLKGYMAKDKNSNWKGGITPLVVMLRNTTEYNQWRMDCLKRDWFRCKECFSKEKLEVHHIKSFAELVSEFLKEYDQFSPIEDKETLIRLAIKWQPFWEIDNGKTLCQKCHKSLTRINTNIKKGIK